MVRSGQRWGCTAHNIIWQIVKASVQVKMSSISDCLNYDEETMSLPSRITCGSCSTATKIPHPNQNLDRTKRNAMLLEKNATPTNLWAKRKHNVGTCHGLHMCRSDILLDRNLPPCSQTVANATNAKTVKQQPYREPTCHERTQKH